MTTFSILAAAVVDLGCYAPTIFKRATPENWSNNPTAVRVC